MPGNDINSHRMPLRYCESGTGRILDLVRWTIDPLGYDDLVADQTNQHVPMPVHLRDVVIHDANGAPVHDGQHVSITFSLESQFSSKVIALVDGGWLPSIWAARDKVILVDRNVVSEFQARFTQGRKRNGNTEDFVDLFADLSVRINPLLYAIEGNQQRHLDPPEVEKQITEAVQKIRSALPNATISPDLSGLQGAIAVIRDTAEGMECKAKFLISVVPRLMAAASKNDRIKTWRWVLEEAANFGVRRRSFSVLAALSCLVCHQSSNPARGVLKPSRDYSKKNAYNALSDLRALELLIATLAMFPENPTTLCTMDRTLALLWVSAGVHNIGWTGGHSTFDVRFERLLPDLTEDERKSFLDGA